MVVPVQVFNKLSVSFLSDSGAAKAQLAFVNDAGNAIMRVDNTTNVQFNQNRNSIRISTKDHFTVGSLWIVDMLHVPYGVSYVDNDPLF